ncbi:Uncharacterised protein [Mycobacteroides abscessus subsp. abscessus]|nr:Uncharacterised protein [Mycobacteroides abscessus subsp. abscessus]
MSSTPGVAGPSTVRRVPASEPAAVPGNRSVSARSGPRMPAVPRSRFSTTDRAQEGARQRPHAQNGGAVGDSGENAAGVG